MGILRATLGDLKRGALPLRNAHVSLHVFQSPRIALLTRTKEPFQTVAEIERCLDGLARALPLADRAGYRVIIDSRLSPMRVNPSLEPAFERFRRETHAGFARIAIVVQTAFGRVRAERLSKISTVALSVVASIEEALGFLNED